MSMYIEIDSIEMHDNLTQNSLVCVLDFYADCCGPCKILGPLLEKTVLNDVNLCKHVSTGDDDIKDKIVFAKINVEKLQELSDVYDVKTIPQISFYKNGKLQADKFVGIKLNEIIAKTKELAEIK